MILILLGTQDKPFTRILEAVDTLIEKKIIKEKVVAQLGHTKYESKNIETFKLIPSDKYEELINEARIIITHAGVGSILTALKYDKTAIVAARLKKYGEHTNDHQLQILDEFSKKGLIIRLDDFSKLEEALKQAEKFKIKKYKSNNKEFVEMIENYIDNV